MIRGVAKVQNAYCVAGAGLVTPDSVVWRIAIATLCLSAVTLSGSASRWFLFNDGSVFLVLSLWSNWHVVDGAAVHLRRQ